MRTSKAQLLIVGLFFSAIAVFMGWGLTTYISDIVRASKAVSWPTAEASVLSSKAQIGCGKGGSYFPSVRYQYNVGSKQYVARRIAYGNCGCGSESSAAEVASQFPAGAMVLVHYNPASPDEAVLIVGRVLSDTWLGVVLMSLLSIGSLVFAFVSFRQLRSNNSFNTAPLRSARTGRQRPAG